MELERSGAPSSGGGRPPWVMFERAGKAQLNRCSKDAILLHSIGDATTLAAARASSGTLVRASFRLASPPEASRLCLDFPEEGAFCDYFESAGVVAAHGDCLLIELDNPSEKKNRVDYFVYSAGRGGDPSRPPSLTLLPPSYIFEYGRWMSYSKTEAIGLLRCGSDDDGEVVVATMEIMCGSWNPVEAELPCAPYGEWDVKLLPVIHDESQANEMCSWTTDVVVPAAGRFLCWANYRRGVIISDVSEESPNLRYIPMPIERVHDTSLNNTTYAVPSSRCVCATAGGAVKLVDVSPRCCCGGPGATLCPRSADAFAITTWTLRVDDDDLKTATWVKDGVITSDELRALPAYEGVPRRLLPEAPVVSMDDAGVVLLVICTPRICGSFPSDGKIWLIEIDITSKLLRSVTHSKKIQEFEFFKDAVFVTTDLSNKSCSSSPTPMSPTIQETNSIEQSSCCTSGDVIVEEESKVASPDEILSCLREIPNLARDDLLRA